MNYKVPERDKDYHVYNLPSNLHRAKLSLSIIEQAVRELYGDNPNLVQEVEKYAYIFIEPDDFKNVLIRYIDERRKNKRVDLKPFIPKQLQYNNPDDPVSDEAMLIEAKCTQLMNAGWKETCLREEMKDYLEMLKSKNKEFEY